MSFDIDDPYHAHAYFAVSFACDDCNKELPYPPGEPASDEWCESFAQIARREGWYVPPGHPVELTDTFTSFCAACAAKRGLGPETAV
jgi:hypothetical protein